MGSKSGDMKITRTVLKGMGACDDAVEEFCEVFPKGTRINGEAWKTAIKAGLPVRWLLAKMHAMGPSMIDVDLSWHDFSHETLAYWCFRCNLQSSLFRHTYCEGTNFRKSILEKTDFYCAVLYRACLAECALKEASFHRTRMDGADLRAICAEYTNFARASMKRCDLRNAFMQSACFDDADLKRSLLIDADFSYSTLTNADLSYCDCTHTLFVNADLTGTKFVGTILTNASVRGAKGADFTGAIDVEGVNYK